ncbi:hypothetical protein GFS31_11280 [Leptolyngbya sp. BL0902]|nr:hypothetical protein GFS31_11280 [Leptolyngbya sp. BL0902]
MISKFTPPINESPTGKDDDSWALHSLIADLGYDNPDLLNQREDDIKQSFLSMVQLFKDGSHPASYLIN